MTQRDDVQYCIISEVNERLMIPKLATYIYIYILKTVGSLSLKNQPKKSSNNFFTRETITIIMSAKSHHCDSTRIVGLLFIISLLASIVRVNAASFPETHQAALLINLYDETYPGLLWIFCNAIMYHEYRDGSNGI